MDLFRRIKMDTVGESSKSTDERKRLRNMEKVSHDGSIDSLIVENSKLNESEVKATMETLLDKCCELISYRQTTAVVHKISEQSDRSENLIVEEPEASEIHDQYLDVNDKDNYQSQDIFLEIEVVIDEILNNVFCSTHSNETNYLKSESASQKNYTSVECCNEGNFYSNDNKGMQGNFNLMSSVLMEQGVKTNEKMNAKMIETETRKPKQVHEENNEFVEATVDDLCYEETESRDNHPTHITDNDLKDTVVRYSTLFNKVDDDIPIKMCEFNSNITEVQNQESKINNNEKLRQIDCVSRPTDYSSDVTGSFPNKQNTSCDKLQDFHVQPQVHHTGESANNNSERCFMEITDLPPVKTTAEVENDNDLKLFGGFEKSEVLDQSNGLIEKNIAMHHSTKILGNFKGREECTNVDLDVENSKAINSQGFDLEMKNCSNLDDEVSINQEVEVESCEFISALSYHSSQLDQADSDIQHTETNTCNVKIDNNSELICNEQKLKNDDNCCTSECCFEDCKIGCKESAIEMDLTVQPGSSVDMDQAVPLLNNTVNCGLELESFYCDENVAPDCENSTKRKTVTDTTCFKWKYVPSCDIDETVSSPFKSDHEKPIGISVLPQCRKPIRLGLSKKQHIQTLHPRLKLHNDNASCS